MNSRLLLVLTMCACLGGCILPGTPWTTHINVSLDSLERVDGRSDVDRQSSIARAEPASMLKIEFISDTDLTRFANAHDRSMNVDFWPCRTGHQPSHYLGFDPKVYGANGEVDSAAVQAKKPSGADERKFHFYVPVAVKDGAEPHNSFDLRESPEEMCFRLWGGATNLMGDAIFNFDSNTVRISKDEIAARLKQ